MQDKDMYRGKYAGQLKDFLGEWIRGDLLHIGERFYIHPIGNTSEVTKSDLVKLLIAHPIDPATVGKCAELRDKNGTLIFEGDICRDEFEREFKIAFSNHFQDMRLYPINKKAIDEYESAVKYGVAIFTWIYPEMFLTIIGNIHDRERGEVNG